ncbi:type III ribulose-bisphosphate carboxylase [Candidatus Micrarchaeota archaeon]|nr:type III ribulose-bisphosphate carboxylase [Candidatus Micrarchaeota archaeon]
MGYASLDYVDLKYRPTEEDLVCEYYLEPGEGRTLANAAEALAAESSIGTWTHIATLKPGTARKLKPHIYEINARAKTVKIAYNADLFEAGSIPQIWSAIAGNVFGMKAADNLRLLDVELPSSILRAYKGPALGIPGIRKMLNVSKRPLIGTIVKPKVGLSAKEHAQVAYEAWAGGLDLVKDDENLTSMKYNKFEDRLAATLEAKDLAEQETGEKKIYVCNVTAETMEMLRRAQLIKDQGGNCAMIDIITAGWAAVQSLREANTGLILHGHRAMHAAITRNRRHGISMLVFAKFARLAGIDELHIGAIYGKMEGTKKEVLTMEHEIEDRIIKPDERTHVLAEKWLHIKPTFAIASGGLHPGVLDKLVHAMGNDCICQAGGGVHGHEKGTRVGATAMRQALEATMKNIPLTKYAQTHPELNQALRQWGTKPTGGE